MKEIDKNLLNQSLLENDFALDVIQYRHYQNQALTSIHENNKEFKQCLLEGINFEDTIFDNCYFIDVTFKNCDLSNIKFYSCLFRRAQFINCKCLGSDFSESMFDNIIMIDSLCGFANFAFMKNKEVHFSNCDFQNASFLETQLNKTTYDECSFIECEFHHSSLYNVDLSTCRLDGIITTPSDIQGAIIDSYQASSLIHLLKIKVK